MAKKLIDEFTNLPISKTRKAQLRRKKVGLCRRCDQPTNYFSEFCIAHRLIETNRYQGNRKFDCLSRYLTTGM